MNVGMSQNNPELMGNEGNTVIAVDAMGGDHGVAVTVVAAINAVKADLNLSIILVGDKASINATLSQQHYQGDQLSIQHCTEVVEMDESPSSALKKKKDSSMRVAINLVKEGRASAVVSAGNTGALMATARFVLKMIPGIERPAICSELPTKQGGVLMLDLGANVDSSPEMLLQFALMGSELCAATKNIDQPRIRLLNVGSEEIKGSAKVKSTAELLQSSELNYAGYIEGNEIFGDKADVIVCDGFEGNIALKTSEGVANLISTITREEFTRSFLGKMVALFASKIFKRIKKRLDPREKNGASLIGLRGVVVKSHGGADSVGFRAAIDVAASEAKLQLPQRLNSAITKT